LRRIRLWALESDYDRDAVGVLAKKLADFYNVDDILIQTSGKTAYNAAVKRNRDNGLKIAVDSYIKNMEDKIVFIVDADSEASLSEKRSQRHSMVNQIQKVVTSPKYYETVALVFAVQELEAWLLVDCIGICRYYLRSRCSSTEELNRFVSNPRLKNLIHKYQKGDTQLIVEPERGGKGAKEFLIKFSETILKIINPARAYRNIEVDRYRESLACEISACIDIRAETLNRNESLRKLGSMLKSSP
jgi:hypothetical protein